MCSKTIFENWLFSASIKGAEANAMIYAVAATASVNGLHMKDYFTRFFHSCWGLCFCLGKYVKSFRQPGWAGDCCGGIVYLADTLLGRMNHIHYGL